MAKAQEITTAKAAGAIIKQSNTVRGIQVESAFVVLKKSEKFFLPAPETAVGVWFVVINQTGEPYELNYFVTVTATKKIKIIPNCDACMIPNAFQENVARVYSNGKEWIKY